MLVSALQLQQANGVDATNPAHAQLVVLCAIGAKIADRLIKKFLGSAVEEGTFTEYHPLISTRPSLSQGFTEDDMILAYEGSPQGARPIRQGRGNSRDTLRLRNLPVRSVTSVFDHPDAWMDPDNPAGVWPANTQLVEGTSFQVDWDGMDSSGDNWSKTGFLYRIGGTWGLQARTTKVVYTGGYTALELEEEFPEFYGAALVAGTFYFNQMRLYGVGSFSGSTGIKVAEAMDDYSVKFAEPGEQLTQRAHDLPPAAKILLSEHVNYSKFF